MTSIANLDKVELLHALWLNTKPAAFFGSGPGPTFDRAKAKDAIERGRIDYFCGRPIKTDLKGDTASFNSYDCDSKTPGATVVQQLSKGEVAKSSSTSKNEGCKFVPFGKPMLEGKPHTVMCAKCGYWKAQH